MELKKPNSPTKRDLSPLGGFSIVDFGSPHYNFKGLPRPYGARNDNGFGFIISVIRIYFEFRASDFEFNYGIAASLPSVAPRNDVKCKDIASLRKVC